MEFIKTLLKNKKIAWKLGKSDFKNRFASTSLGSIWGFLQPFIFMIMYVIVFQGIFGMEGDNGSPYVVWFLPGMALWQAINDSVMSSSMSIRSYSYLVKKVVFPVDIIPIISLIGSSFVSIFLMLVATAVCAIFGYMPNVFIIIYIIIALICIISIVVVIGVQILGNDVIDNLFGINKITKRSEEEEAVLKNNFENIFDNSLENDEEYQIQKINNNENIIYTSYTKEDKNDNYEINVNLPYINIENKEVKQFNKEIKDTFEGKAEETIKNKNNNNIIYTVKYKAYIENNNLSLIIYSDLKQSTSAQRVIIQTFNYDLKENKENKLEDTLNNYSLKINDVQNKINNDIQKEQKKSEELIKLGYNVFSRDINSDIYKIDNITEYFVYKNNIYIIFAYGNIIYILFL